MSIGWLTTTYRCDPLTLPQSVRVTFNPRLPGLPIRQESESITVWHLHHWQTLGVDHIVLRDEIIQVEQIGRQRVDLIGGEGALCIERHAAIDEVPDPRRVRRADRQYSPVFPGVGIWPRFEFDQPGSQAVCPRPPVAYRAQFLLIHQLAFRGGAAPRRQLRVTVIASKRSANRDATLPAYAR